MSKPIVLSDDLIVKMMQEFEQKLRDSKLSDGKLTYTKNFSYQGEDATKVFVVFTPVAYIKMLSLLQHFSDEVAWHGLVERKADDLFLITDIIVYPQEVTGATVNTDQERYQRWFMELDDDAANHLHMQGHSHVNMATTPSSTDLNHQEMILQQLTGDAFYIFMIWNKRLNHNIKVYDFANNTLYEDDDVEVSVAGEDFDLESFLSEADDSVIKKSYASKTTSNIYSTEKASSGKGGKGGKSKGSAPTAGTPVNHYPGRYSGYPYAETDYDQMIFGGRFDT